MPVLLWPQLFSVPVRFPVQASDGTAADSKKEELAGLAYDHSLDLEYATQFSVDYYEGGYALISIADDGKFLLVPDGKDVPEELDENISVIRQPVDNIYLVATSAMDFFCALDGLDCIGLSGTDADGWYIEEAKEALGKRFHYLCRKIQRSGL